MKSGLDLILSVADLQTTNKQQEIAFNTTIVLYACISYCRCQIDCIEKQIQLVPIFRVRFRLEQIRRIKNLSWF